MLLIFFSIIKMLLEVLQGKMQSVAVDVYELSVCSVIFACFCKVDLRLSF